jgi:small-conductance mechanosensitive channel
VLARRDVELGVRQAIATIFHYVFVFIGFLIILSTAGIDVTALNVLAGAIGIGVGFGLQTIANNFISGLIILFERPIKVGDRIQVGDVTGDVVRIAARATSIRTNDNIDIIVPNADFISSQVINWSHSDREVRLHVPVGVSYSSDPEKVREILLEVASEHKGVLKSPAPDVIFVEFGDSSLNFDLRVWTSDYITKPKILRSDMNFAIRKKLKERGIEIPFPQRDVHIRSVAPTRHAGRRKNSR